MITLFVPASQAAGAVQVADLLYWAENALHDGCSDVEARLAGAAARMAFEFHLHDLCRQHGPPKGQRWHSFAVRLYKCGVLSMGQYRDARRIARLGQKAVHGKPFDAERARLLLERVEAFVISTSEETEAVEV